MEADGSPWTSLEIVKLVLSAVTPIVVVFFGLAVNKAGKRLDQFQWTNQKLIERRLTIFDEVAPKLNHLYCYFSYIGRWKEFTPAQMIDVKRTVDEIMFVNRSLLSTELFDHYLTFMDTCFKHFTGVNQQAQLRTELNSPHGDRRLHFGDSWKDEWSEFFVSEESSLVEITEISSRYDALVSAFAADVGVAKGT